MSVGICIRCNEIPELASKIYEYADLIDAVVDLGNKVSEDNLEKLLDVIFKYENLVDSISELFVKNADIFLNFTPTITELHKHFFKAENLFDKL